MNLNGTQHGRRRREEISVEERTWGSGDEGRGEDRRSGGNAGRKEKKREPMFMTPALISTTT